MLKKLSKRASKIKPSATMAVDAKAKELRDQGAEIINLSVGEPDFDTPDFIKEIALEAIENGHTKYTAADGTAELKEAIINKLKRDNQLDYQANNIVVSNGLKHSIYNVVQVLVDEGDEVIIPAPYWVSYPSIVKLAGGTSVIVTTTPETRLKMTAEQLEAAITPKTRLLILNSPSNPSGIAYTADELKALSDVLIKYPDIIILSDDIYEYILWGMDQYTSILNVCPALKDRTVIGNGMSKAYAMTGWRIGYIAAPEYIATGIKKIQSQSTGCPNSIAQKASAAALNGGKAFFTPMLKAFKRRHDMMLDGLRKIDGVECLASDGTFYLFPNMTAVITRKALKDDLALASLLLEKAGVAIVPGTAFGLPGYIRLSCATSDENLKKAIDKISEVLS
jgi:aspartate aminotransferase